MEPHERLADELDLERQDRVVKWTFVARELNMSPQHLLRIRQGKVPITRDVAAAIDKFLGRDRGYAWSIIASGTPLPSEVPARREWSAEQRARWKTMSGIEIVDEARRIGETDGRDARIEYLEAALAAQDERRAATEDSRR